MNMKKLSPRETQDIIVFRPQGAKITVEVHFKRETVWLTQAQIAVLFGTKRPAITKHLLNIFKNKELNQKSVCSILEHTATDGKVYKTQNVNNENWNISTKIGTSMKKLPPSSKILDC